MGDIDVTALEVIEDFSGSARCDEGFLQVRRLRVKNRRADGSVSPVYRVDVIDRPKLDAIAVLVWRRTAAGALEFLTRQNLRPAAYFRKDKTPVVPDTQVHLFCEEIVAGLLEPEDVGVAGLQTRGAAEVLEEVGYAVQPSQIELLGAPFLLAPGILSEKIFAAACDVTGLTQGVPQGDGSPLEEGGKMRWRSGPELLAAVDAGQIQDAKTELILQRFLRRTARET